MLTRGVSVRKVTTLWAGRPDFSPTQQDISFHHNTQTGYGAHHASYPMGTGFFLRGKAAEALS
jgi:hypothetical protein